MVKVIFLRNLKWIFSFIVISLGISIYATIKNTQTMVFENGYMLYLNSTDTVVYFLNFFMVSILFSWIYYFDKSFGYIDFIHQRYSKRRYEFFLLASSFLVVFFSTLLKEQISYFFALELFSEGIRGDYKSSSDLVLRELYLYSPYLYCLFYSLIQSLIFGLYSVFSVILSFYVKNFFVIATSSLLYHLLSDIIFLNSPFYPIGSMIFAKGYNSFYGKYATMSSIWISIGIYIVFIVTVAKFMYFKDRSNE